MDDGLEIARGAVLENCWSSLASIRRYPCRIDSQNIK